MNSIKTIDTFSFNGEPIVKLRLEYLYQFVDKFVIVEAMYTHSGQRKGKLYKEMYLEWFLPYNEKIHWVIIDEFPEITEYWLEKYKIHNWMGTNHVHWFRETYQRDTSKQYIMDSYKDQKYIVCVGDVDEIPDVNVLELLKSNETYESIKEPVYLEMHFFYYTFEWKKQYMWYRSFVIRGDKLNDESFTHWRIHYSPKLVCRNAGWHCSYFMTPVDLKRKIESFAHRECDIDEYKDALKIQTCIEQGKDIFMRGEDEDLIRCEISLPTQFYHFNQ